jgi:hypothetical protein
MKAFIVGLWVLIVSLGTSYAVAFIAVPAKDGEISAKPSLTVDKTRVINVPIIAGGALRGFIVAQFAYTVESARAKSLPISPEVFLLDEAFRTIYADDHLDFLHLEKYDVTGLTTQLVAATNRRLGEQIVHDVLIQDFSFISKEASER